MTVRSSSLALHPAHPWPNGHVFESPGGHLTYRVVGPCCRLYDRNQLPWPCCRLQWRSKEPSWRRIGKRFVVDMATRKHPSYCVEIVGQGYRSEPITMTLYTVKMTSELQNWWHTKRLKEHLESALDRKTAASKESREAILAEAGLIEAASCNLLDRSMSLMAAALQ